MKDQNKAAWIPLIIIGSASIAIGITSIVIQEPKLFAVTAVGMVVCIVIALFISSKPEEK